MDPHCAFRLRAPSPGEQRNHAEGATTLFRLHLGKSFSPREALKEKIFAPFASF